MLFEVRTSIGEVVVGFMRSYDDEASGVRWVCALVTLGEAAAAGDGGGGGAAASGPRAPRRALGSALLDARSESSHRSSVYEEHGFYDALALRNRTVEVRVAPVARPECERRKAAGETHTRANTEADELSGLRRTPTPPDADSARRAPGDPGGKFKLLMVAAF